MLQRPIRYWAYGKSGLTAQGIESEMIGMLEELCSSRRQRVDCIVISCGVNNVLWGHSASRFGREVVSLLDAVNNCFVDDEQTADEGSDNRPMIILLGLLDFSHMPFLPWPLCSVLGWKSRSLHSKTEEVVKERGTYRGCKGSGGRCDVIIALIPPVGAVLDGSRHNLLRHLDEEAIPALCMDDIFAFDGFHPAKHGTAMLGNLFDSPNIFRRGKVVAF